MFSGYYSKSHGGVWNVWSEPFPWLPGGRSGEVRGDHVLELLSGAGRVLVSVPFNAEDQQQPTGEMLTNWRVPVVDPPEYGSYRVVRVGDGGDRAVVYELVRSDNAPVVELQSPAAGEVVEGPAVELSLTVSDADGDELSVEIHYSTDGGATYRHRCCGGRVGPDRYGETISRSLDRARLEGSERARVMVVVSDGARWAAAESPVFSSAAPYVPEPVAQQVPVRFVASAGRGDQDGAVAAGAAGVTVAIVEWHSRDEWWEALGAYSSEDGIGIRDSIPPGARIASTTEQIAAAPAQLATTAADATAHAELDRSTYYMFCAVSPADPSIIAGCTSHYNPLRHNLGQPVTLHIYFSHGRAYLSAQDPAPRATPDPGTEASVTVVATSSVTRSYANAAGEAVWRYLDPNQDIAIIADADIGLWWDTVTDGSPAALSHDDRDYPIRVAGSLIEASPAQVITTDHRGIATASTPAGNYLLCAAQRAGRKGDKQLACIYHHLTNTHDNILNMLCCDQESGAGGITALNETDGRALLEHTHQLKAR